MAELEQLKREAEEASAKVIAYETTNTVVLDLAYNGGFLNHAELTLRELGDGKEAKEFGEKLKEIRGARATYERLVEDLKAKAKQFGDALTGEGAIEYAKVG